jgi:hypothetical protein
MTYLSSSFFFLLSSFFFLSLAQHVGHNVDPMLFQGTLCGGAWARDKESAARLGCCPKGSYMSSPEKEPFTEETSCKQCPIGVRFYIANAVKHD